MTKQSTHFRPFNNNSINNINSNNNRRRESNSNENKLNANNSDRKPSGVNKRPISSCDNKQHNNRHNTSRCFVSCRRT